jgi:hypothetical protein
VTRHGLDDTISRRERESSSDGDRYVDMCIDVVFEEDPEKVIVSAGGRWDRRMSDYDDERDAERCSLVRVHRGQVRAMEWWRTWLEAHAERRALARAGLLPAPATDEHGNITIDTSAEYVYSALFAGGRRGGKTYNAVAMACMYAVAFPDAIVWIVSPNDKKHEEVRRYLATFLAAEWLESETALEYALINGAHIYLKSAHNPEALKEGECDFAVLNEGQRMKQRAFTVVRGAIVDKAGLVLVCANPPVETGDQTWVTDFATDAAKGRRAAVYLLFNPLENPHIDRAGLLSMQAELDEHTFAIEVLGEFRGPRDAVAYNWLRLYNETKPPKSDDVTEQLMMLLEEGEGIRHVVGLDVQRFPHIGGPVYHFFGDPDPKRVLAWITDEIVLEGGDEVDFCAALREAGYDPEETLIICDASGQYQHSRRRSLEAAPPAWHGRGSFDIIKNEGFLRIVPPDRRMKANPHVLDRVRAFTSMISTKTGHRRLFANSDAAPKTVNSIRDWRTLHGVPHRQQEAAHLGDAASYPIVRLFPRRRKDGNTAGVDTITERVDKPSSLDGGSRITPTSPRGAPRFIDRLVGDKQAN